MVTYAWSGVLQPVNADGSSVFKSGSTVPMKFALTWASAGVTNASARLFYAKLGCNLITVDISRIKYWRETQAFLDEEYKNSIKPLIK